MKMENLTEYLLLLAIFCFIFKDYLFYINLLSNYDSIKIICRNSCNLNSYLNTTTNIFNIPFSYCDEDIFSKIKTLSIIHIILFSYIYIVIFGLFVHLFCYKIDYLQQFPLKSFLGFLIFLSQVGIYLAILYINFDLNNDKDKILIAINNKWIFYSDINYSSYCLLFIIFLINYLIIKKYKDTESKNDSKDEQKF